jgi:hypothetical protein
VAKNLNFYQGLNFKFGGKSCQSIAKGPGPAVLTKNKTNILITRYYYEFGFNASGESLKCEYFPKIRPAKHVIGKITFFTKLGISGISYSLAYFVSKYAASKASGWPFPDLF